MPLPEEEILDDPRERLRAAFAKLMLQGQGNSPISVESLWAQQAARQALKAPPPPMVELGPVMGGGKTPADLGVGMPQVVSPPGLNFPTADPAGSQLETMKASKPFPGAKEVEVKPYGLPKSPEAQQEAKRRAKLMPKMSGDPD